MKTLWSYTVFGNDFERYYKPLLKTIELTSHRKDIEFLVSTTETSYTTVRNIFEKFKNVHVRCLNYSCHPVNYRFLDLNTNYDFISFKDSDSVITAEEIEYENHAKKGNCPYVIRANEYHFFPIMAGLWGIPKSMIVELNSIKKEFIRSNKHKNLSDQLVLSRFFYSKIAQTGIFFTAKFQFTNENTYLIQRSLEIGGNEYANYSKSYESILPSTTVVLPKRFSSYNLSFQKQIFRLRNILIISYLFNK